MKSPIRYKREISGPNVDGIALWRAYPEVLEELKRKLQVSYPDLREESVHFTDANDSVVPGSNFAEVKGTAEKAEIEPDYVSVVLALRQGAQVELTALSISSRDAAEAIFLLKVETDSRVEADGILTLLNEIQLDPALR